MKKTLLAAALAVGFAGAAHAETSVTLYGIIDTGLGYNQIKGEDALGGDAKAKKFGIVNGVQSGSRWGLKGTEDLGNGLQAIFQLESGFDSSTGFSAQGDRLFGRQATIGLQSASWGRLDLGRQTNIASKYFGDIASPFGASFGQANIGATFGSANTLRLDNSIMYQTPNFSGFQFGLGYSFNMSGAQDWDYSGDTPLIGDDNDRVITAGLRYANGPIGVALTYDRANNNFLDDVGAAGGDSVSQWNLGASYDFEVAKLHLGFGQIRDGWMGGQNFGDGAALPTIYYNDGFKANLYTAGVSAPIGNGKLMASWAMADPRGNDFTVAGSDEKQQIYSLGYTYNLSKRTNVYALGSYAKHVAFQNDLKSTVGAVGIRHQF